LVQRRNKKGTKGYKKNRALVQRTGLKRGY
jgi:hypothetical protein